jgi:hypothetical protein
MTTRQKLIDALDLISIVEGGSSAYESELVKMAEHKLVSLAVTLTPHERQVLVGDPDPNAMLAPQQSAKIAIALRAKASAARAVRPVAGLTAHELVVLRSMGLSPEAALRAKAVERQRIRREHGLPYVNEPLLDNHDR